MPNRPNHGPERDVNGFPKRQWHGFVRFADFFKASASLGLALTAGVWAVLTYALDERYAPIETLERIERLEELSVSTNKALTDIRVWLLRDQMYRLRENQCEADSPDARSQYARRIYEIIENYRSITGSHPDLPDCSDV